MGMLDGLLGGIVGAEMATTVNSFIQQHGGVHGSRLAARAAGTRGRARSWIGNGANQPISADQLSKVFGSSPAITQLAAKTGLTPQDLAQKLSQILPTAIDKLTPGGTIPPHSS